MSTQQKRWKQNQQKIYKTNAESLDVFIFIFIDKSKLYVFTSKFKHKGSRKKKSSFLSGRATKRGGGKTGVPLELFFNVRKKVPMATNALVAGPLRKELFFAASLRGLN